MNTTLKAMTGTIISTLQFFGITPDRYPFLVLGMLIVGLAFWQNAKLNGVRDTLNTSLNASIKEIDITLNKIKRNIMVIVTFLATTYPGKFDAGLIETMSPLRIKEGGYDLLSKSGFTAIMKNQDNRTKILACIAEQNPTSKLDVERYAIVYFPTLLEEAFMMPIKAYLYNVPTRREIFPTLAGLYIRDEYLKDHPEITQ